MPGHHLAGCVDRLADARRRAAAGSGRRASTLAAFTPAAARRPGCTTAGPGPGSRGGPRVVVGYVGSLRRRHGVRRLAERRPGARHPAGRRRRRTAARWLDATAARAPSSPGPSSTGDLTTALRLPRRAGAPGRATRPAATRCARPPRAACPWWRPRSGGAPDVVRHLETGPALRPAPTRTACAARSPPWSADRHRAPARRARPRARAAARPGPTRSTSWSTCHYAGRASPPGPPLDATTVR